MHIIALAGAAVACVAAIKNKQKRRKRPRRMRVNPFLIERSSKGRFAVDVSFCIVKCEICI